jgi:hypothetical protein
MACQILQYLSELTISVLLWKALKWNEHRVVNSVTLHRVVSVKKGSYPCA